VQKAEAANKQSDEDAAQADIVLIYEISTKAKVTAEKIITKARVAAEEKALAERIAKEKETLQVQVLMEKEIAEQKAADEEALGQAKITEELQAAELKRIEAEADGHAEAEWVKEEAQRKVQEILNAAALTADQLVSAAHKKAEKEKANGQIRALDAQQQAELAANEARAAAEEKAAELQLEAKHHIAEERDLTKKTIALTQAEGRTRIAAQRTAAELAAQSTIDQVKTTATDDVPHKMVSTTVVSTVLDPQDQAHVVVRSEIAEASTEVGYNDVEEQAALNETQHIATEKLHHHTPVASSTATASARESLLLFDEDNLLTENSK